MTDDEFRERLAALELRANRASFACVQGCNIGDFFAHMEPVLAQLSERIEADYYGVPPPEALADPHLAAIAKQIASE